MKLMKPNTAIIRHLVWLAAVALATLTATATAHAQTGDEPVDMEGATQITQIFIVVGVLVMAAGFAISYQRNKKS